MLGIALVHRNNTSIWTIRTNEKRISVLEEGSKPMRTSGSIANVVTNMANIITPAIEQTFSKTSPSSSKQLESENSSFNINHGEFFSLSGIIYINLYGFSSID